MWRAISVPEVFMPTDLLIIQSDSFTDIAAHSIVIPASVTEISGNPFEGSSISVIYGYKNSAAEYFATTYSYTFVPINDTWMDEYMEYPAGY